MIDRTLRAHGGSTAVLALGLETADPPEVEGFKRALGSLEGHKRLRHRRLIEH